MLRAILLQGWLMADYQYIYTMQGVGKITTGKKEILKDIYLSFFPGAKIGVLGLNGAGRASPV